MSRPVVTGPPRLRAVLALLAAVVLAFAGCSSPPQMRAQVADETERDRYQVQTVGDVSMVGNAIPVPVGGVGLVVNLEGTGGDCPSDHYRAMLVHDLQKRGQRNVKELLSSPNHALVIVEGVMPAGVSKNAPLDLTVKLPPGSKATSLRGGFLMPCLLFNYDFARNLAPGYNGPRGMLMGHPIANASGPVQVGVRYGEGDETARLKTGRIWGGGHSRIEQPFALMLNPDQQFARVSAQVAIRVNEIFQTGPRGLPSTEIAHARDNQAVILRVPPQYKHNLPRYLRVIRAIPLRNVADLPARTGEDRRTYRQRLEADLLNPARTVTAAIRLEALGSQSIPVLKRALQHSHPLVRFCSAEALAYLGDAGCAEELAKAVTNDPLLRSFGLTALASLDEAVCYQHLSDLLELGKDDELRYGAFLALHTLNESHPAVEGELLNESFWLHRVAAQAEPLIHLSSARRAEVVLFGRNPRLIPPLSILAGEFTITASKEGPLVSLSRFPRRGAPLRKQCGLELHEVLRAMAQMGGCYGEVVTLLEQANKTRSLTCRICCDAVPQAMSVYDLVKLGQPERPEGEALESGESMGTTPTLYDLGLSPRQRARQAAEARTEPPADGPR